MKVKVRTFEELVALNQQLTALEEKVSSGDRAAIREMKRIKKILSTSLVNTVRTKDGLQAIDDKFMSIVRVRPKIKAMGHFWDAKEYAELGICLAAALATKNENKMNALIDQEGRDDQGNLNFDSSLKHELPSIAIAIAEADGVHVTRAKENLKNSDESE